MAIVPCIPGSVLSGALLIFPGIERNYYRTGIVKNLRHERPLCAVTDAGDANGHTSVLVTIQI